MLMKLRNIFFLLRIKGIEKTEVGVENVNERVKKYCVPI